MKDEHGKQIITREDAYKYQKRRRRKPLPNPEPVVVEPEEHPEDKQMRLEATEKATSKIDAFVDAHKTDLQALIQVYRDADAEESLWRLREEFWTNLD